jgi:hypothetical protein
MNDAPRCPIHDTARVLDAIAPRATLDMRSREYIALMRKAIQSGSTLDTARILGSNEFLALHSKQRAYIALFGFYSALYSHTGEKVLERITSHGSNLRGLILLRSRRH